jgi:hypothetical protein
MILIVILHICSEAFIPDFQGRDRLSTGLHHYKRPSFYEGDDVHDHGQRPFDHAGNQQELLSKGGRVVARLKKYQ